MRAVQGVIVAAVSISVLALSPALAYADDEPQPVDFTHNVRRSGSGGRRSVRLRPRGEDGNSDLHDRHANRRQPTPTARRRHRPHNETSIAVNPTTRTNRRRRERLPARPQPGRPRQRDSASRAHVTFDGGRTWSMYPLFSNSAYQGTGDPALAFDASGHAYYGTLGFRFVGPANATNPDVLVSTSPDGGKTWNTVRVAAGSGNETSVGDLLDKEYVAAWGNGNAIVTYGDFRLGQKGASSRRRSTTRSRMTPAAWSTPQVISGKPRPGVRLRPVVAADGRIYVAFLNTTDLTTGRDDYEVVEVSPGTGAPVAPRSRSQR